MKRIKNWMMILAAVLAVSIGTIKEAKAQPGVSVSFNVFYDNLSPYGDWIQDPTYGYVWVPRVGAGFRPYYTDGYWAMTEYGNTWVSNYAWGWAPFHYGRWTYDNWYGWVWIPDNTWGPAWVSWRTSGSYYGWAPLGPGIGVTYVSYSPPVDWWVFIPPRYIHDHHFHNYYSGPRNNTTIINNTTVINNTYVNNNTTYVSGPRRGDIERTTNQKVNVLSVSNSGKPGREIVSNNRISTYQPQISGKANATAPRNVQKAQQPIGKPTAVSAAPQRNSQGTKPNMNATQPSVKERVQQSPQNTGQKVVPGQQRTQQPTRSNTDVQLRDRVQQNNTPQRTTPQTQPQRSNDVQLRDRLPQNNTQPRSAPQQASPQRSNDVQLRERLPQNQPQPRQVAPQQQPNMQRSASVQQNKPMPNGGGGGKPSMRGGQ